MKIFFFTILFISKICFLYAQEFQKIRINPEQAYGGSVSDYFSDIEYIPLETSKESMFGYISRLIVTDSSFVIHDMDTHTILFFDLNGKFLTKVKGKGNNYSEDIEYNKDLNYMIFTEKNRGTDGIETKYYNKLGNLMLVKNKVHKTAKKDGVLSLGQGYYVVGQGCATLDVTKSEDETPIHRIEVYKKDSLYSSFLPLNPSQNMAMCAINGFFYFTDKSVRVEDNAFYVSTPLDYMVYYVNKDTAKAVFQFVFPANRVFSNEILQSRDKKLVKNIAESFMFQPDPLKIMNVSNIFYRGDNLFFKLNPRIYVAGNGSEIQHQYNFIYNTDTNKLISLERMTGDEKNYFLPIFNERIRVDGLSDFANDYYYSNISSFNMFKAYKENTSKQAAYPPILTEYFKTQNHKSNPVIVRMKLKD